MFEIILMNQWPMLCLVARIFSLLVDINVVNVLLLAADKSSITRKLKHDVIEGVNHLILEISGCHEQIAEQAIEHIHQKYLFVSVPFYYL